MTWIKGPLETIMTRPTITAQAHTALDRHEVTRRVADAMQAAGGLLTDVRQFSNVALMLHCEIAAASLPDLLASLASAGIHLTDESTVVAGAAGTPADQTVEFLLHLRFYNEEPDLRIPTPAVPG